MHETCPLKETTKKQGCRTIVSGYMGPAVEGGI